MRILIALIITVAFATANAENHRNTIERVAETGEFRIGYVPDAPPLSFRDKDGNVVGYSIDLCKRIATAVREAAGLEEINIVYKPLVTIENRLSAIENGEIDIECGTTTLTLSRRERVDFTLMTFITGSTVLARKAAPIDGIDELDNSTIAVLRGTTTEAVLRKVADINDFDIKLALVETHDDGMELLNERKVDGYASDRAMLIGQVFRNENASKEYALMRSVLSFEPYALMVPRGDTRFRLVADKALASLYRGLAIRRIYHNWFGRFGEPLSPIVEAMYEFQAVGE